MIRFANPEMFLLLIGLFALLFLIRNTGGRIQYSNIKLFDLSASRYPFHPRMALTILRLLALAGFIVALARPQSGRVTSEVDSEGVDILLALDASGSMEALDFKENGQPVNRLHIVKKVVSDFIRKRPSDRIGIVVFGEEAFIQCPLTLDHGIVLDFLKQLEIGMAGDATAIGSAIAVSVKRIKDIEAKEKIVILMTDGRNNTGRIAPLKAAEIAATYNVKVYTIGVGTEGKAPFLQNTIFGKNYVYHDVDIDEDTLREIAKLTGGKYYRATDTSKLEEIYNDIDALEKSEVKVKEYTEYDEVFHWALIGSLILLLLEIVLANTRLRKIP